MTRFSVRIPARLRITVCLILLALSAAETAWAMDTSLPKREELYVGLDPGFVLPHVHEGDKLPKFIRANFRLGWCFYEWMHFGADFSIDILTDHGGLGTFRAPKVIKPMLTFFPVAGFNLRLGPGWDPEYIHRLTLSGGIGYEFPVDQTGGVGIGLEASQFWHFDGMQDWQVYSIVITFTAYRVNDTFKALTEPPL